MWRIAQFLVMAALIIQVIVLRRKVAEIDGWTDVFWAALSAYVKSPTEADK